MLQKAPLAPLPLEVSSVALLPFLTWPRTLLHLVAAADAVDLDNFFSAASHAEAHAAGPPPLASDAGACIRGTTGRLPGTQVRALMADLGSHWGAALLHTVLQGKILHARGGVI